MADRLSFTVPGEPKRRPLNRPEEAIHRAVVNFLAVALPAEAVFWHTPNGGGRSKAEAGILKALGTLPGMPDLFILHQGVLHGIELKAPGTYASARQKDTIQRLHVAGVTTHICRSVEEVERALRLNGVPMRARAA